MYAIERAVQAHDFEDSALGGVLGGKPLLGQVKRVLYSFSMLNRSGLFRVLLTVVLAVAVPFCCCDFQAIVGSCGSCERLAGTFPVLDGAGFDHEHSDGVRHHHDAKPSKMRGKISQTNDGHVPLPCSPEHKEEGNCKCGTHDTKMLTVGKPSVEFYAPVLIAFLAWPGIGAIASDATDAIQSLSVWPRFRPPTSLLHLHCALVV